jgi:hypothetical protein
MTVVQELAEDLVSTQPKSSAQALEYGWIDRIVSSTSDVDPRLEPTLVK